MQCALEVHVKTEFIVGFGCATGDELWSRPGWSSSCKNARPSSGWIPSMENKFAETRAPYSFSGSPTPVRLKSCERSADAIERRALGFLDGGPWYALEACVDDELRNFFSSTHTSPRK